MTTFGTRFTFTRRTTFPSKGCFRSVRVFPWTWAYCIWNNVNTIRRSTYSGTHFVKTQKTPKRFWLWRPKCRYAILATIWIPPTPSLCCERVKCFVTVRYVLYVKLFCRQRNLGYDEALSKYTKAVADLSECSEIWNNIGMCFFGKHKYVAVIIFYA